MSRASLVVILAEDQRHQSFARRYLQTLGYRNHALRFEPLPSGRGCGEHWVRTNYSRNVAAYRNRSTKAQTALVVIIDADRGDRDSRIRQLEQALIADGMAARGDDERIAALVPRRSIETWILCLTGTTVNEEHDYSNDATVEEKILGAAREYFSWTRVGAAVPANSVPSLQASIPEIRRIE